MQKFCDFFLPGLTSCTGESGRGSPGCGGKKQVMVDGSHDRFCDKHSQLMKLVRKKRILFSVQKWENTNTCRLVKGYYFTDHFKDSVIFSVSFFNHHGVDPIWDAKTRPSISQHQDSWRFGDPNQNLRFDHLLDGNSHLEDRNLLKMSEFSKDFLKDLFSW